jgi:hypothetical protein
MTPDMLPGERPRELLVKEECTHKGYGKDPYTRSVAELLDKGVINLDKPYGPTSHEVTAWVKNILHIKRAGHSGTLDPHVTGVLPTMLGDATRLVRANDLSRRMVETVNELDADLIVLTGDYLNTSYAYDPVAQQDLRQTLGALRAHYGIYAVRGNIESALYAPQLLQGLGITWLDGNVEALDSKVVTFLNSSRRIHHHIIVTVPAVAGLHNVALARLRCSAC